MTPEEQAALDARARSEGVTRSKVLRDIIDLALGLGRLETGDVADALLLEQAGQIAERARLLARDDPDLRSA